MIQKTINDTKIGEGEIYWIFYLDKKELVKTTLDDETALRDKENTSKTEEYLYLEDAIEHIVQNILKFNYKGVVLKVIDYRLPDAYYINL